MVVHPQLLQSDRQWHQSIATVALLAAVLWIGSLDRKETNALAVQELAVQEAVSDSSAILEPAPIVKSAPAIKSQPLIVPVIKLTSEKGVLLPKNTVVKDRKLLMRIFAGIDKEGR